MSEYKNILKQYVNEYEERIGSISKDELTPLVVNLTCLVAIKNDAGKSMQQEIAQGFGSAALELFSHKYSLAEAEHLKFAVNVNLEWDGISNFLNEYFTSKLGVKVFDSDAEIEEFYSSYHVRFESLVETSRSEIQRLIKFSFENDKQKVIVSIHNPGNDGEWMPGLSPKVARLDKSIDNINYYRGDDPDFYFEIWHDSFGTIEHFVLNREDNDLKIAYFE
jgi:hypothetical protein